MKIIDLNGTELEITDLTKALAQAKKFRHLSHTSPAFRKLDWHLKAYWRDVYEKLLLLQCGAEKTG